MIMRRSTAVISAVLMSLSDDESLAIVADAFGLRPSSSTLTSSHRRRRQTSARLGLLDPNLVDSATIVMGSPPPSFLLASSEVAEALGSLALLGSVGFGVFSGMRDPDFHYEYKVGNDAFVVGDGGVASDLALLEVSPIPILERVSSFLPSLSRDSFRFSSSLGPLGGGVRETTSPLTVDCIFHRICMPFG
jgi:hypothetical protein